MATVSELREKGYKVFVKHARNFRAEVKLQELDGLETSILVGPLSRAELADKVISKLPVSRVEFLSKGGRTSVDIFLNETLIGSGVANCSEKDAYSKKIGRNIALGRALENLNMSNVQCNWSEIINEVGADNLRKFATRQMTARAFEGLSSTTRKLVRSLGAEEVRSRARQALSRRQVTV